MQTVARMRYRKLWQAFLYALLVTFIAGVLFGAIGYIVGAVGKGLVAGGVVGLIYWGIGSILVLRIPARHLEAEYAAEDLADWIAEGLDT